MLHIVSTKKERTKKNISREWSLINMWGNVLNRLIKGKTGWNPVNERVKHYQEHNKTKPCKGFKILLDNNIAKVPESFLIYFFNE